MSPRKVTRKPKSSRQLWFERFMAILALANLGLVLFDLSYVPWRDFYRRQLPAFTIPISGLSLRVPALSEVYDPLKGIEPHRETQRYLNAVDDLKNKVAQSGLQSPEAQLLLQRLGNLSAEMIENNPFAEANKTGNLEKIKNRMRERIGNDSAKQSFRTFWSQPYLSQAGWVKEIEFYDAEIQPYIEANYFRQIGENGHFIDNFWKIDIWFFIPFAIEFLLRTYVIHRRHNGLSWMEAMLWRWYDIFLLLPFLRWLRVIPVTIRLHQAELLNLEPVQTQISQGVVANFAEELTEVVVIRVINQVQGSIRRGEITGWLSQQGNRPYIDINNTNEIEALVDLFMQLAVRQVLPKVLPDLEAILRYNIEKILSQSPVYRGLLQVPGLGHVPTELTEKLVADISRSLYSTLTTAMDDPVSAELSRRLMQHFSEALGSEFQRQQTLQKIQSLLSDLLEEIKINYVERLSAEDLDEVMDETRAIRKIAQQ